MSADVTGPATAAGPPPTPTPAARSLRGRRAALAGAAVVVVVVVLAIVVLTAGGSSSTPPASGAAKLVPANALVYVHVSTDRGRSATASAAKLAGAFPSWPVLRDGIVRRL
ncbi:MAG: hypothetical protein QOF86_1495, partial [Baekduia sp.]|nr:hypothetical protein [Baekduia sp.]